MNAPEPANRTSVSHRRRAIYTGLAPFLSDEERLIVLCMWQRKYSDQPAYALNKFITDICEFLKGDCSRAEINRNLVWSLGQSEEQLEPDPEARMGEYCKRYNYESVLNKDYLPHELVFENMFHAFIRELEHLENGTGIKTLKVVFEHLHKLDPGVQTDAVKSWLLRKQPFATRMLDREQMQKIMHLAYVCGCEYCGPVETDRAMSSAVREAAKLPEARIFPPEKFT